MSKVQLLTNEELLKRAGHAGRNLSALAILATIFTFFLGIGVVLSPKDNDFILATVFLALATAGYWMLAIAAKRGNPTPVTVVMALMSAQFLMSLTAFVITTIHPVPSGQVNLLWIIVALLVIAALASSRTVLLEMKKRGVWEARFGSASPSLILCVLGGIALVVGYIGVMASLLIPAINAAKNAKAMTEERQQAQRIVSAINGDEAEFMKAMQVLGVGGDAEAAKNALSKLDVLDQRIAAFQLEVPSDGTLARFLVKYKEVITSCKSGVIMLGNPTPDLQKVKETLETGDRLRKEARIELDKRYSK